MQSGESFDVHFVDQCLVPGGLGRFIATPAKTGIDDCGQGSRIRIVAFIKTEIRSGVSNLVTKSTVVPNQVTTDPLGIGIQQNFVRIKAKSPFRIVRAMCAKSVKLARSNIGQIPVPDMVRLIGQRDPICFFCRERRIKKAQVDLSCVFGKHGKIDPIPVPSGAQRRGVAWPNSLKCHPDSNLRLLKQVAATETARILIPDPFAKGRRMNLSGFLTRLRISRVQEISRRRTHLLAQSSLNPTCKT